MKPERIVLNILVHKPVHDVWKKWITPADIQMWNVPSDNWCCKNVSDNFIEGGTFYFKMETKDGKISFEHRSKYDVIVPYELIGYTLEDSRRSVIEFQQIDESTIVRESFEPEAETEPDEQKKFCQAVLNNFKKYTEAD